MYTKKVHEARSVLVVGAGVVGVETAAELGHLFNGKKKIGLCVRGDRLLPTIVPKAGQISEKFLKEKGVTIHYKTSYTEAFSAKEGYEVVIQCTG